MQTFGSNVISFIRKIITSFVDRERDLADTRTMNVRTNQVRFQSAAMRVIEDRVQDFSDLPPLEKVGRLAKVVGDADAEGDDYYIDAEDLAKIIVQALNIIDPANDLRVAPKSAEYPEFNNWLGQKVKGVKGGSIFRLPGYGLFE